MTKKKKEPLYVYRRPEESGQPGSQPGPNTVGTDEIIDNSVMMEDLNQSVKDEMMTRDDRVTQEDLNGFNV